MRRLITTGLRVRKNVSGEFFVLTGSLVLIVLSLVSLSALSMELLSAVRAYVTGEGLWSKAQKEAVLFISRYARTGAEDDYQQFQQAIQVPLGDHSARVALSQPKVDLGAASRGFLDGRNHPEDIHRLIWLFQHFRNFSYMRQAIDIWSEADLYIEQLDGLGRGLHEDFAAGRLTPERRLEALSKIEIVNRRLTPLEDDFSKTLGVAARMVQWLLLMLLCAGATILIVGGCATCFRLLNRIRESERKYRHLMATASDAIVIADVSTGRIIEANQRAEELLDGTDLSPGGFWGKFVASVASGNASCHELQLHRADGASIPIEVSANLTRIGSQPVVQSIIRDITIRKRVEEELRAARDHALDSSRVKGQFLANMSHEIRTPMNGVLGMITVLLGTELNAEQREFAEVAKDSAESLLQIINDILDFSRMEAGRLEVRVATFDLREISGKVVEMLRGRAEQKGVALSYWCDPALPAKLNGDDVRLRQILTNLLNNAIKFTDKGSVTLRILEQSAAGQPGRVRFEVEDTGIGIPIESQKRLFEAFSQADGTITRKYGGTGLGLAISKQLVQLMGGEIGVSSKAGEGSMFWFDVNFDSASRR